jgi:glycosyltransferase involved in cell wall biosynthesis
MSPERPLISVLLLCYNHSDYVGEAVNGILNQTYSPLEILIFDDCSLDDTAKVIEAALAARQTQHRVRFVRNPKNLGAVETLKLGFEMVQGSFIVLSCGDDIMLPHMVEEMAKVWAAEAVSLVTANAYYIDENSKSLNRTYRDPGQRADDSFETLVRDGTNACCFGAAIGFEREIYTKFGWPPEYLGAYDIMLPFYAYLLKGARFIDHPLLKYRVHGQNTSLSLSAEKADERRRSLVEERIYLAHLAHATLMQEELERLRAEAPERYSPVAERIMPLLNVQLVEMSKKLVRVSRQSGTLAADPRLIDA